MSTITTMEFEQSVPNTDLSVIFSLRGDFTKQRTEFIMKRLNLLTEIKGTDAIMVLPVLKDELRKGGILCTVKVAGGFQRHLSNLAMWLADKLYSMLGRERYLEIYKIEVPR